MTYKKAEIRVLGYAVTVIQNLEKVPTFGWDSCDQMFEPITCTPAYDLDV